MEDEIRKAILNFLKYHYRLMFQVIWCFDIIFQINTFAYATMHILQLVVEIKII